MCRNKIQLIDSLLNRASTKHLFLLGNYLILLLSFDAKACNYFCTNKPHAKMYAKTIQTMDHMLNRASTLHLFSFNDKLCDLIQHLQTKAPKPVELHESHVMYLLCMYGMLKTFLFLVGSCRCHQQRWKALWTPELPTSICTCDLYKGCWCPLSEKGVKTANMNHEKSIPPDANPLPVDLAA